jgi:hypothetical protein
VILKEEELNYESREKFKQQNPIWKGLVSVGFGIDCDGSDCGWPG